MNYYLVNVVQLACLLLCSSFVSSQRVYSQSELKNYIPIPEFKYLPGNQHECSYLNIQRDAYSPVSSGSDNFFVECCAWRTFSVCRGQQSRFQRSCCPGFVKFIDLDNSEKCNERILADKNIAESFNEFRSETVKIDKFINSVFKPEKFQKVYNNENTWTIFAVANEGFDASKVDGSMTVPFCKLDKYNKTLQGTNTDKKSLYDSLICERSDQVFKHLVKGRRYIKDFSNERTITSMFFYSGTESYPLKFARYSNGITCIECAAVLEANYEMANGVVHILNKGILREKSAASLGDLLSSSFSDFWNLLDTETKNLLNDKICDVPYTVFVPKDLSGISRLSGDERIAAAKHHIVKGVWCTAGMIDAESDNIPTLAAGTFKFACGNSRTLLSGGSRSSISSNRDEFDIMAINGVIQQIDSAMTLQKDTKLLAVFQLEDEHSLSTSIKVLKECVNEINLKNEKGYILILPSDLAFQDFLESSKFKAVPEARDFKNDIKVRCQLLRHHILETEQDLTDMSRATHQQEVYTAMDGSKMTDFLFMKNGDLQTYFMDAQVQYMSGRRYEHGHVYAIDKVLIPPTSQIWERMITNTLPKAAHQMLATVATLTETKKMYTTFVPDEMTEIVSASKPLTKLHTMPFVFYTKYLDTNGESITLPSLLKSEQLVLKKEGTDFFVSLYGDSRSYSKIKHCGMVTRNGVVCVIENPIRTEVIDITDEDFF